jgi:cytochrome b561
MVQASRSPGLRSKGDPQPSDGVVLHGYLERFVTTSGKDDLGRLCFLDGVMVPAQSDSLHALLWDAHFYLAFAFFAVVLLHVAAALPCTGSTRWRV